MIINYKKFFDFLNKMSIFSQMRCHTPIPDGAANPDDEANPDGFLMIFIVRVTLTPLYIWESKFGRVNVILYSSYFMLHRTV